MTTDETIFDVLPNLDDIKTDEDMEAAAERFSTYIDGKVSDLALDLYLRDDGRPDRAWTYTNADGGVFLAQGKDRGEAYRIIEDTSGDYPVSSELKRCRSMDGLGYSELWGLYAGIVNTIPCATPSCARAIYVSGLAHGSTSGILVDEYNQPEPIAIGTDVYCSRSCYERSIR